MKLHEYQIEDARRIFDEYREEAEMEDGYDNSRALIKRFVEMVGGWIDGARREPVIYTHRPYPVSTVINPYGDRP